LQLKVKVRSRRQAVFEYPQKDKPFVEDLGRSLRSIDVKGFIVGQDYAARAKRLIEAFEKHTADLYFLFNIK